MPEMCLVGHGTIIGSVYY